MPKPKPKSIDEALRFVLTEVELERIPMGRNKAFMGSNERYVEARLDTCGTHGVYSRLVLTLYNGDHESNRVSIDLTDKQYAPTKDRWSNPNMPGDKGGYFWLSGAGDSAFYNYEPRADRVGAEVNKLLKFWKVGAFGS